MSYAEVAVNVTLGRGSSTFHYSILPSLAVSVGQLVVVPFGQRSVQGVVVGVSERSPVDETRDILSLCDPEPMLSRVQVDLARWISERYLCPLIDALRLFIPTEAQRRSYVVLELGPSAVEPGELTQEEQSLVQLLTRRGRLSLAQVSIELRAPGLEKMARRLSLRGVIQRSWELSPSRVRPQTRTEARLKPDLDLDAAAEQLSRAPKQLAALNSIVGAVETLSAAGQVGEGGWVVLETLRSHTGLAPERLRLLAGRGLIETREAPLPRRAALRHTTTGALEPPLTAEQQAAWDEIRAAMRAGKPSVFLLHGVTGSGKTEVYMRAVSEALEMRRQAIVLVPEIVLTPQTLHRFSSRFPGKVAVLHSQLSLSQRREEWRRLREGEADVVVGPRSAAFAPLPSPGVIIVDEEHEWSYKQDETPRYHGREVAIKLASLLGIPVILGSATPDLSSYYWAKNDCYRLLELRERVEAAPAAAGAAPSAAKTARTIGMPPVEVVDMRGELRAGNTGLFSRELLAAIAETLETSEQSILFLNRRGAATMVMCHDCGHALRCRRCDVSLVYHSEGDELVCHQCNRRRTPPERCPACREGRLRYIGAGTQRVEWEIARAFPKARVLRWDRDAARGRQSYDDTLGKFTRHEVDILVGTQMIAKGIDLPLVTLVGVISGDTVLHLPDFRAAERTFQLLTQVAGRAGRGPRGGRVILQTLAPDHYCIEAASQHDYASFYEREMAFRREHGYVPFNDLARLLGVTTSETRLRAEADELAALLRLKIRQLGLPGIEVLGPAPRYVQRVRGRYRWQVLVQGRGLHQLLRDLPLPVGWAIDVDPVTTL